MLHRILVKNLFGLYTYELGPLFDEDTRIRFITGPNGYGKSTILSMISHLMRCELSYFKSLSFDELQFYFDNKLVILHKADEPDLHVGEDASKGRNDKNREIFIRLIDLTNNSPIAALSLSSVEENSMDKAEIEMFLNGESHYYIKDQRLLKDDAWSVKGEMQSPSSNAVNQNASSLKSMMQDCKSRVSSFISIQNLFVNNTSSSKEEYYEERKEELTPILDKLKLYGLVDESFNLPVYQREAISIIWSFLNMVETAVAYAKPLLQKIDIFKEVIERSDFADKELQISPEFGYRFISNNQDRTLLDGSDLSSGEQHILIQTYELIFNAPEGSLALIDEPEMSFHMIWQMDYLKNLAKIAKINKLQCLVATHSPQIFDSMWNLTFDLYDIMHPRIEE